MNTRKNQRFFVSQKPKVSVKSVRVILLDEADSEFNRLNEVVGQQKREGKENTEEMQLLRSIRKKSDLIKVNPFYGDNIEKRKIPKSYNVQNLWRVELTGYWRMLYTIRGDQIEIICFILDKIYKIKMSLILPWIQG